MFCPHCGHFNETVAQFCSNCSGQMPEKFYKPREGLAVAQPEPSAELTEEEYYRAIIGPGKQDYYLERFRQFDLQRDISATWHWPSLFVFFYWLLYRKMWLNAVLYFIASPVIGFVLGLLAALAPGLAAIANFAAAIGFLILPPMYANALYYRHCQNLIREVKSSSQNSHYQLSELRRRGETSGVVLIIVLIFVFIALIGIMAAIALPAYQDYTQRARTTEALYYGKQAQAHVAQFYGTQRTLPSSLAEAGFNVALPQSVSAIEINPENGTISIIMASAAMANQALLLEPSVDSDDNLSWQCRSDEIDDKYLPIECRSNN